MASAVRIGNFLCSSLIEQAWVGQGILVLSLLALFLSLQPTSSDASCSAGGDPSDVRFNIGVERWEASSGVAELSFWQADLITTASAASSVVDSLVTLDSLRLEGGGSEDSNDLTTSAVMVEKRQMALMVIRRADMGTGDGERGDA